MYLERKNLVLGVPWEFIITNTPMRLAWDTSTVPKEEANSESQDSANGALMKFVMWNSYRERNMNNNG